MTKPKILNPLKEIWLCYGEIAEDTEHDDCVAYENSVTWCDTPQDSADVRYVLAQEELKP